MAAAVPIPLDLAGSQEELDRKRKLAELLTQQSLTPPQGQMISGHYVGPGIGTLLPLVQALAARKIRGDVVEGSADLRNKYNEMTKSGLESYFQTRQGVAPVPGIRDVTAPGSMTAEQADALLNGDTNPAVGVPGNLRKAAIEALTSQIPMLQELGKSDLQNFGKTALTQKDILGLAGDGKFSPDSAREAALGLDIGKLQPALPKEHAEWTDPYTIQGPDGRGIMVRKNKLNNEVVSIASGQVINIDTSGNKEALQQAGKNLETARNDILNAKKTQMSSARILSLLNDPSTQTGPGATAGAFLANLGNKLGFNGPDSAAKTQALAAELAKNVLDNASALKPLSDSDIQFLKDVTLGKVGLNRESLRDMAGLAMANSHNAMLDALERYQGAASVNGVGEIAKQYPRPPIRSQLLPESSFEIGPDNRASYKSQLTRPNPAASPKTASGIEFLGFKK